MRDFISQRAHAIPPSGIRRFFDIVQEMDNVISLGVGEPDYSTPWVACQAGIASIEQGQTAYTSNRGLPALREEIGRYLKRRFDVTYN
ncbi:MAG TPA: pyridoxal phosphate-dependent aminotransferase, partial [Methanoculleus sp.]|nr:pyridoxal phosphate-dependent aminotransferase [Methanoculleus sp.]